MKNEEIYKLIEKQGENTKEILDARLRGFKAEIKSGMALQVYKLDELIEYQKKQNGRTSQLEENIKGLAKETRIFRLIHKNPKAAGVVIGLALLGLVALFIIKNFIA